MTSTIIKFDKQDLLSFDDMEKLIVSCRPNEKAKIVSNKLLNYLLMYNGKYFSYDVDNVLYNEENNDTNYVISVITLFIETSYISLSNEQKEILQLKYKKSIDKIFTNSDVNKYYPQLATYLTNNTAGFNDPQKYEVHFLNGYHDFKTNKFLKRVKGKHYVNAYVNRILTPKNKNKFKEVLKDIDKIYSDVLDRDCILQDLGMSLTGLACSEQTMLFLLGRGSSGKSTIMELCKLSFPAYVLTLPKQTFSMGYAKIDKVLNTYRQRQCIKISYINELVDQKLDGPLFKDHTDGNIQSTTLYQDGSNDFHHFSKMVFTSNTMPKLIPDTGMIRRIDALQHNSEFVDKQEDVNESKNIYLKNKNFLAQAANDEEYLNSFFYILVEYATGYINKTCIYKKSKNFNETKNTILSSNDIVQDFVDKVIVKTKYEHDRIGKEEMFSAFISMYPKSFIKTTDLTNTLKDKKFNYEASFRCNKVRGCFTHVKLTTGETNDNEDFIEENKDNIETQHKNLIFENKKNIDKIKELMEKIKILENEQNKSTSLKDINDELNNIDKISIVNNNEDSDDETEDENIKLKIEKKKQHDEKKLRNIEKRKRKEIKKKTEEDEEKKELKTIDGEILLDGVMYDTKSKHVELNSDNIDDMLNNDVEPIIKIKKIKKIKKEENKKSKTIDGDLYYNTSHEKK